MASSSFRNSTRVDSTKLQRAAEPPRSIQTPVSTSWTRPPSLPSISAAWPRSLGFPRISPSRTTMVSAARTRSPEMAAATRSALSSALARTRAREGRPPVSSSTSAGLTMTSNPASRRRSRRRGDPDARTMRRGTGPFFTGIRSTTRSGARNRGIRHPRGSTPTGGAPDGSTWGGCGRG